jgi:hypothetical protein
MRTIVAFFLSVCLVSNAKLDDQKVVAGIGALDEIGRIHITNFLLSHGIKPLVIEGGLDRASHEPASSA